MSANLAQLFAGISRPAAQAREVEIIILPANRSAMTQSTAGPVMPVTVMKTVVIGDRLVDLNRRVWVGADEFELARRAIGELGAQRAFCVISLRER